MLTAIEEFHNFYAEVFLELAKYGEIEDMQVCDNLSDHMFGNLYCKFVSEDDAAKCRKEITGRMYGGKLVVPEFSPVSNFSEGRCRQYEDGTCKSTLRFLTLRRRSVQLHASQSGAERTQEGSLPRDVQDPRGLLGKVRTPWSDLAATSSSRRIEQDQTRLMIAEETRVKTGTRMAEDTSDLDPETGGRETRTGATGTEAETVGPEETATNRASVARLLKTMTRVSRSLT